MCTDYISGGVSVIKQLQSKLPGYSFADLVVLAAAYAVKITNGPDIFSSVRVGRRDVKGPDPAGRMPEETLSAAGQIEVFAAMGFSTTEMLALLGSHTIGGKGFGGPLEFDNVYYQSLLQRPWEKKDDKMASMIGLASDRVLPDFEETRMVIERFAGDQAAFFKEFDRAFIKLSELGCDV
jgi:L-ascorbate peroxidase